FLLRPPTSPLFPYTTLFRSGLYGHSDPVIQAAFKKAIDDGTVLGGPNQYEARLAAAIRARFPSVDLIRFTNSGTEANLLALSARSEEHTSELQSLAYLVCRL